MKPSNVVTEVFDGTTWSTLEPYPYWVAINSYGVVSLPDQVVLFGGRISNANSGSDIIASFKPGNHGRLEVLELPWIQGQNDTWSQLGELNLSRFAHSAMLLDDSVFIIGGYPGK